MLERCYLAAAFALATTAACFSPSNPAYADDSSSKIELPPAIIAVSAIENSSIGSANSMSLIAPGDTPETVTPPPAIVPPVLLSAEQPSPLDELKEQYEQRLAEEAAAAELEARDKQLSYDPAIIETIGNQAASGHTVCCPGYACAYGDAIISGEVTDHAAYGCGMCTWPGWGGGNSSFRSLGSNAALLREAYDEIAAGRPTVIHVMGASNEHWITLIGYSDVEDPDNLELSDFTALDPYDGAEINAGEAYSLYGDFCEHVSER